MQYNNNSVLEKCQSDEYSLINSLSIANIVKFSLDDLKVEPKNIIHGFIVEGGINIFIAPAGSGKTMLLYSIMIDFLRQKRDCLYLDLDNPVDLPADRGIVDIIQEENLQNNFVYLNTTHYIRYLDAKKGSKGSYWFFLKDILDDLPSGSTLFIDSIQNFVDVNDQNQVTAFMRLLRQASNNKNLTILCLHHLSKNSGKAKGHTQIEDMADSVYFVNANRDDNLIVSWTLKVSKQRYRTLSELTIKFNNEDFTMSVSDVAIRDSSILVILRVAVKLLKDKGAMKQSDLINEIKAKLPNIGEKKIYYVIKEYTEKKLFVKDVGFKNTYTYSINPESKYLIVLFNTELSQIKRNLLDTLNSLALNNQNLPNEIRVVRNDSSISIYRTIESIKRNLFKMTDDEAQFILNELQDILNELQETNNSMSEEGYDHAIDF